MHCRTGSTFPSNFEVSRKDASRKSSSSATVANTQQVHSSAQKGNESCRKELSVPQQDFFSWQVSHARDAIENGFEVIIVADCTAGAGPLAKEAALANYEANEVVTTDQIISRPRAAKKMADK